MNTLKFLSDEIGISTLARAGSDVYIIIIIRMVRLVGFGATSLILALYLKEIGFNEDIIGLFMTITFVGDLIGSFLLSILSNTFGRKNCLIFSFALTALTGLAFALLDNHYVLTAIAFFGILTPSGGEVGPFRSIEQAGIASLMAATDRSDIYAWYTFLGMFCGAIGSFFCGHIIDYTTDVLEFNLVESYKFIFLVYSILSFFSTILCFGFSNNIEIKPVERPVPHLDESSETEPLLNPENASCTKSRWKSILPELHSSVLGIVIKMSLLFALDSFASSLVPLSWQSFYIKRKFDVPASYLGSVFFITGIVSGFTSLLSTTFTKRLGAVVTMVVTHLPASILLGCVPIPESFKATLAILVFRASTQSMDVAPKHVFLATLIPDSERTIVFCWVNVVKTLAQVLGPIFTGTFTKHGAQWITFVIASVLKSSYDIGMLGTFLSYNRHTEH
jgi:MFS family permease